MSDMADSPRTLRLRPLPAAASLLLFACLAAPDLQAESRYIKPTLEVALRKAQASPDEYRNLLVRVAGYSDYFVDLDLDHQEEIIRRTEQDMA